MPQNMLGAATVHEARGIVADLLEKLGGKNGREEWLDPSKRFLRRKDPWLQPSLSNVAVWRTLTIGGYSREELLQMFEAEKFLFSDWGRDLMTRPEFVTSATPYTIRLGRVRVGDLGSTDRIQTPELFKRLAEHFDECPPETGPHLRRIYRDQPLGEWLSVYQKPIVASDGDPDVFALEAFSVGLRLRASGARPEDEWFPEFELVVRLRE